MSFWGYNSVGSWTMVGTFVAAVLIAFLLWAILRKKDIKYRTIPLMVITAIMLILEVVKQIISIKAGYSWWMFPMHFCSLFLYIYPLAVFAKGKIKDFGLTMAFVCSLLMFVFFYINPIDIIGLSPEHVFSDFYSFHTFIYHHLVILFLFASLLLNVYNINRRSFVHVLIGFTIYGVVAVSLAHALNVNFCNLLTSNIPFMESLRQSVGQILYTIIMWLIAISCSFAVCVTYLGIKRLICHIKSQKISKNQ